MTSERQAVPSRGGYSQWFVVIVAVFVTCLITANITAVKLVSIFGLILPAGVIVFPISSEPHTVEGRKKVRKGQRRLPCDRQPKGDSEVSGYCWLDRRRVPHVRDG